MSRVVKSAGALYGTRTASRRLRCQGHLNPVTHWIEPGQLYVASALPPDDPQVCNTHWMHARLCMDCCPVEYATTPASRLADRTGADEDVLAVMIGAGQGHANATPEDRASARQVLAWLDEERATSDELVEKVAFLRDGVLNLTREELVERITAVGAAEWKTGHWLGEHDRRLTERLTAAHDETQGATPLMGATTELLGDAR